MGSEFDISPELLFQDLPPELADFNVHNPAIMGYQIARILPHRVDLQSFIEAARQFAKMACKGNFHTIPLRPRLKVDFAASDGVQTIYYDLS
jgi:hypothetical protein